MHWVCSGLRVVVIGEESSGISGAERFGHHLSAIRAGGGGRGGDQLLIGEVGPPSIIHTVGIVAELPIHFVNQPLVLSERIWMRRH